MNLNNLLIDSDVLEGVIRLPIQLLKPVRRAFSGSVASLPMRPPVIQRGALCIYQAGYCGIDMTLGTGNCPKCGISDWKLPRHVRTRGVTSVATADLNIITCNKCGFTEFYELTEEELAPINKKAGMIFIFAAVVPTLIGIGVSIWLIWG